MAVVIVGGGLAGLAAAVTLADRGSEIVVIEKSDGVGGRVRTDVVDGFLLDRGFQILLTAYPVAQRVLDYEALDLRRFAAGSLVQLDGERVLLGDPFRRYQDLVETVRAPVGTPLDKARLLRWRQKVLATPIDDLWTRGEVTTASRLSDMKFSEPFVDRFLRPLFAGITLDPKLEVTSRFSEFVFRMLSEGYGAVPARGMGQLPAQLRDRLPPDVLRLNTSVVDVGEHHVSTDDGERIDAEAVIVATDMDAAASLVGTPDLGWNSVTTWWFAADDAPYPEPLLLLNGTTKAAAVNSGATANSAVTVNSVAVMSNVSPHYAPAGRHLIAASSPGAPSADAASDVTTTLANWFGRGVADWELLRTDVIAHALPRVLPGEAVPAAARLDSGVFVAGDHRQNPSINGALQSGRTAARAVLASQPT
jgi:phytoene dehydrogenase-like protein